VAGVTVPPFGYVAPPTPPPDIDLEAWGRSLDVVDGWDPARVCITHFGPVEDVGPHLGLVREALALWGERARANDPESFVQALESRIRETGGDEAFERFFSTATPEAMYAGFERYWRKRAERAAAAS
jgi:hypothetical protein